MTADSPTAFIQDAPCLDDPWTSDHWLGSYIERVLPDDVRRDIVPELTEMGRVAGTDLYDLQLADRLSEPRLVHWDAWGRRVDRVELTPLWRRAAEIAARAGLVAIPYERRHGRYSRLHQFALVYLFHPSSDVYTCPLAMSDGAARTLIDSDNAELIARALPRLTSRDPAAAWTSGQWMTESTGGSDVGASLTIARPQPDGRWRLYGRKWFTSATTSEMALTLARPEGNGPGGGGLAMFYVETRDGSELAPGLRIERLKDKLGTRKVPTAELTLEGLSAQLVAERSGGTRAIEPMLKMTRTWNSVCAIAFMRRGFALAGDYARRRVAFGAPLASQPLHADTLAGLEAELFAGSSLTFALIELIGKEEAREISDAERALLRLLLPLTKLTTGKQAVAFASEVLECFGGAGYVEDTGLPALLRDSQVLPIWEGTTNVLSLDALLRTHFEIGVKALRDRAVAAVSVARGPELAAAGRGALAAIDHAIDWERAAVEPAARQAGARRLCLTLGRAFALALLVEHAQWAGERGDPRYGRAARRFGAPGANYLLDTIT